MLLGALCECMFFDAIKTYLYRQADLHQKHDTCAIHAMFKMFI